MRVLVLVALLACDDQPAQHAAQARPMDEPRAQEVIAKTFENEGIQPEAGRSVTLTTQSPRNEIKLEVGAAGHKYGVVWLTRDLMQKLGSLLPKHDNDEGPLVVLDGIGKDAGAHVLALWETDYMTDDLAGEAHSATEIAAEAKLERDVRDFLAKAKSAEWP